MAIGDGIGNGIEEVKVNEHDDVMGRGFTCLKRHLLIGASGRLCLITRRGIPNARLPLKTYPLDLNLQFAYNTLLYSRELFSSFTLTSYHMLSDLILVLVLVNTANLQPSTKHNRSSNKLDFTKLWCDHSNSQLGQLLNQVNDYIKVSALRCQDLPDLGMRKRTDFA